MPRSSDLCHRGPRCWALTPFALIRQRLLVAANATCGGGQANSALNVQGGASPFPVPDSPQFPVRCPLGSLH
jgi:hypothetical protein